MAWTTAIKAIGSLIKRTEPLVKSARKMPSPRTRVAIPKAVIIISKESNAIGAQGINHYNDILKQIPEGANKEKLLAHIDKEAWAKPYLSQRDKFDKAVQELLKQGIDIRRGINPRGITEISQIKPYGYWTARLPQSEIKFGFSYPALLKLSELDPIAKTKFLRSLEEALQLPLKSGGSSKISDLINITRNNITITIGDIELGGRLWKDGVYTINTVGK